MKIAAATVNLSASHDAVSHDEQTASIRAWVGSRRPDFEQTKTSDSPAPDLASAVARISDAAQEALRAARESAAAAALGAPASTALDPASKKEDISDPRIRFIRVLLEILTGQKIDVTGLQEMPPPEELAQLPAQGAAQAGAEAPPRRAGFGVEIDIRKVHTEEENTSVAAQGSLVLADGRRIAFDMNIDMQRSLRIEESVSLRLGDAQRKDPLVLSFDGGGAQLSTQRFSFDIDSDGLPEQLAMLANDAGFLALDRNGDGRINNGSELFGAGSGDGFADLAVLDDDGNGWIDESDAAWKALRLWRPGENAAGQLQTLAARQVGALYLGSVESPFTLASGATELGAVRRSGLWLSEEGTAGALQHIDLNV